MPRLTWVCLIVCGFLSLSSVSNSQQLPAGSVSTNHHIHHGRFGSSVNLSKLKSGGGIRALESGGSYDSVTHDAQGRVTKVLEPDAAGQFTIETDYAYDSLGHVTQITQKGSRDDAPRMRSFTYDSNGYVVSATSPEAGTTVYTRDSSGNVTSKTDARGNTITYSHDSHNRLTGKQYTDGSPSVVYDYGRQNHEVHYYLDAKEGHRYERVYHYDAQGGIDRITQSFPLKQGNSTYTIGLSYDSKRRLAGVTYPDGRSVTQQWSAKGRLQSVGDRDITYFSGANYWPSGYLHTAKLGNGVTIDKGYNREQKLQSLIAKSGDITLLNKSYLYTDNGSIQEVADVVNPDESLSYTYDLVNRVSQATQGNGSLSQTFQYDAFGNLSIVGDNSVARKFDSSNRFDGSSGLTYDEVGEMTFDGTHRYAYNADGLISDVDDGAVQYGYDAEGYRVQKTVGKSVSDYVWLDGLLLAEHLPDGMWIDYIYANGQRIASVTVPAKSADGKTAAPQTRYFLTDPQGTVRMALSSKGDVTTKGTFAPFGTEITKSAKSSAASISYSDEVHDEETGLDTYQYRSYNPRLGRWMSPDPSSEHYANLANPQSLNLYTFVTDDPLKFIDDQGLDSDPGGDCAGDGSDGSDGGSGCEGDNGGTSGGSGDGGGVSCGPTDGSCVTVTAPPDPPVDPDPPPTSTPTPPTNPAPGGGGTSPTRNPNLKPCPTTVPLPKNPAPTPPSASAIQAPPVTSGTLTISTNNVTNSGPSSGATDGHAWITFTTDAGVTYTYGTWGNQNGLQHVLGVNENTELMLAPSSSLTTHLTAGQGGILASYIASEIGDGTSAWSMTFPCSGFASAAWNAATGQNLDPTKGGLLDDPTNLQNAINAANGGPGCS
jgi:RHS repeat-associated protein